jgi:hypothetical protein
MSRWTSLRVQIPRAVLAIALSITCCLAAGEDAEDLSRVFLYFQNGMAPSLSGEGLRKATADIQGQLAGFAKSFPGNMLRPSASCKRYGQLVGQLSQDIQLQLAKVGEQLPMSAESDAQVLSRVRLRLLIPAFNGLFKILQDQREAGYGAIDAQISLTCDFQDRHWAEQSFADLNEKLIDYHREALGNPGILQLDQISDRLLQMAQTQEQHRQAVSNELLVVTTAASLVFWAYGPALATAAAARALGFVPSLLNSTGFVFVVRGSALTAETYAYRATNDYLVPPEFSPPRVRLADWNTQITAVESLVSSPADAADVYWSYLNQVKLQLSAMFDPWLNGHAKQLRQQVSHTPGDELYVDKMVGLIHETRVVADRSIENSREIMPFMLAHDYGYNVDCSGSLFSGPSAGQCLQGLRTLARLIYSGELPRLRASAQETLAITLAGSSSSEVEAGDDQIHLTVPVSASSKDMAVAVHDVLIDHGFQTLDKDFSLFRKAADNLQVNAGVTIDFQSGLTRAERWNALNSMVAVIQKKPEVFSEVEAVRLSRMDLPLVEEDGKLVLQFDANDSAKQILDYLSFAANQNSQELQRVSRMREQNDGVASAIEKQSGLRIACDPEGRISASGCFTALNKLGIFLSEQPKLNIAVSKILIVDGGEQTAPIQPVVTDSDSALMIRSDVQLEQLYDYSLKRGWIHE